MIALGVDTLCWHLLLERGEISVERVLEEARDLGCDHVQLSLHHVRTRSVAQLESLGEHGLLVLASGDFLGAARKGDRVEEGVARVEGWLEGAAAIGSPILRVASGFYRVDLVGEPETIELERRYVIDVLAGSLPLAESAGIQLVLENHSDFSIGEYRSIVEELPRVGVFLDLINPIAALDDPLPVIEQLAPLAPAGHVKDYEFRSIQTDDAYHRRGFEVLYRYPGEGVAPLRDLVGALRAAIGERPFFLGVEGLDNRAGVHDQLERLRPSLALLRELVESPGG